MLTRREEGWGKERGEEGKIGGKMKTRRSASSEVESSSCLASKRCESRAVRDANSSSRESSPASRPSSIASRCLCAHVCDMTHSCV